MATFQLPPELSAIHNDVIEYPSKLETSLAGRKEQRSLATDALANIHYTAILCHRGIRTLCEEGWTPICPIVIRTMLDHCASCIAIINSPDRADYMGFKYFAPLYMRLTTDPVMTPNEQKESQPELEKLVLRLPAEDQNAARKLIKENAARAYWFEPEYKNPKQLLGLSAVNIHSLYKLFSGPAHGSFSGQVLFNDDPTVQDINPRNHPRGSKRAVEASSRLLLEIARTRDVWEGLGYEADCDKLLKRLTGMM